MSVFFDNKIKELHNYIDKWAEQIRKEMGMSEKPNGSIGVSFMPESFTLPSVPVFSEVKKGFYATKDRVIQVEVVEQRLDGLVVFNNLTSTDESPELSVMSTDMFVRWFEPFDVTTGL